MRRNTKPFNGNYHALPGTADSLRGALPTCFSLASERQKTDLSICSRAQLARESTSCSLFTQQNNDIYPIHDRYNLRRTSTITGRSVSVGSVRKKTQKLIVAPPPTQSSVFKHIFSHISFQPWITLYNNHHQ